MKTSKININLINLLTIKINIRNLMLIMKRENKEMIIHL